MAEEKTTKTKAPESEKPEAGTTTALVPSDLPVGVSDDVALSTLDVAGHDATFRNAPEKKPRKRTTSKKKTTAKRKTPAKKKAAGSRGKGK